MTRICISGWGAVTPAGWGMPALRQAMEKDEPMPETALSRPDGTSPLSARLVPPPVQRPQFMAHARFRRASDLTHHATAAVLEALEMDGAAASARQDHVGLIACLLAGCTQYSARFFHEVLHNPSTASPLLFPETVFNAPASHIAALLGGQPRATTLIGDTGMFLQGLALGAHWLQERKVDRCIIVGAEEINWLLADATWNFDHGDILAGGAGALVLQRCPDVASGVVLETVTDAFTYSARLSRLQAASYMRRDLTDRCHSDHELLVEGTRNRPRQDAAETAVWRDWPGRRLRPKMLLGEGLMAASAWQCVLACDALVRESCPAANVSIVGCNQQAIGTRIVKCG
jgi:hypothetical protein